MVMAYCNICGPRGCNCLPDAIWPRDNNAAPPPIGPRLQAALDEIATLKRHLKDAEEALPVWRDSATARAKESEIQRQYIQELKRANTDLLNQVADLAFKVGAVMLERDKWEGATKALQVLVSHLEVPSPKSATVADSEPTVVPFHTLCKCGAMRALLGVVTSCGCCGDSLYGVNSATRAELDAAGMRYDTETAPLQNNHVSIGFDITEEKVETKTRPITKPSVAEPLPLAALRGGTGVFMG